jgi:hypothetical protein
MPFVTQVRREWLQKNPPEVPGDLAYLIYKEYLRRWNLSRRWTTAHDIYRDFCIWPHRDPFLQDLAEAICPELDPSDVWAAARLAYMVFYERYVSDYERKKREENGDIQ